MIAFESASEGRVTGEKTDFYSDHSFLSSGAVDSFGNAEAVSNRCIASVAATAGLATNTDIFDRIYSLIVQKANKEIELVTRLL